jgi:hypothetical protein
MSSHGLPHSGGTDEYAHLLGPFIVFAEQMQLAADLLADGGTAKGRMALVALDHLAEVELFRHCQRVFEARDDGPFGYREPRFTEVERRRIRDSFTRKVKIGTQSAMTGWSLPRFEAVLDEGDASILRVAHAYRNGVYHEDRHNPALLLPLGKVYWHAVGRAWTRFEMPSKWWSSDLPSRLPRLRRLGYELPTEAGPTGYFDSRSAAEMIVKHWVTSLWLPRRSLPNSWLQTSLSERREHEMRLRTC